MGDPLSSIGRSGHIPRIDSTAPQATGPDTGHPPIATVPADHKTGFGILTGKELVERMGTPPTKDIRIGSWVLKTNSVAYKSAIDHLDTYQSQLKAFGDLTVDNFSGGVKDALAHELNGVIKAADAYQAKHAGDDKRAGRRDVMADIKAMAQRELAMLDKLDRSTHTFEIDVDIKDAVALARGGVFTGTGLRLDIHDGLIDKARSREAFGAGAVNTVSLLTYGGGPDAEVRIVKPLTNAIPPESASHQEATIRIDPGDRQIAARNIATHDVANLLGLEGMIPKSEVVLHQGSAALAMERAPGEELIGFAMIPASGELLKALNGPDSAEHQENARAQQIDGQWMVKRSSARPLQLLHDAGKPHASLALTGQVQKGLLDLQVLDAITGQTDRHGHNIFVRVNGDTASVHGIDNDTSFGTHPTSIPGIDADPKSRAAQQVVHAPPLMSRSMADKLTATGSDTFRASLPPALTEAEKDAAVTRFEKMKGWVATLAGGGLIVDNFATWRLIDRETGKPVVDPATGREIDASAYLKASPLNSYVTRDATVFESAVNSGVPISEFESTRHI